MSSPSWTLELNKVFENALAKYDKDMPDRWEKVAQEVGIRGWSADEMKRHYNELDRDVERIDSMNSQNFSQYGGGGGSSSAAAAGRRRG